MASSESADTKAKSTKGTSRIQARNRARILDAALNVFSKYGYRGATLDQIAAEAGLSKPNILYYFSGKEEIHVTLLDRLLKTWLDPLKEMDPEGSPKDEILGYVRRKLDLALELPRESRLFANEVIQGAPRIHDHLERELKPLLQEWTPVLDSWMEAGQIARHDPMHLIFTIWAITQHYADFAAQIEILMPDETRRTNGAQTFVTGLFEKLLTP